MDITPICEDFSITAQIHPADVAGLADAGYKSIICNRPDGEGEGQPAIADIAAAAAAMGMECRYLPVIPGQITDADVAAFKQHADELPRPILGFCATGMRASTLWSSAAELASPGE